MMKKVLFVLVALCLVSAPAFALSIKNSKHNLSSGATSLSGTGSVYTTNVSGICVFCHTPHAASTDVSKAPLWNRDLTATGITAFYNSTTLTSDSGPTTAAAQLSQTDALLCMSCHDGSNLGGGLVNPSNEIAAAGAMTWNGGTYNSIDGLANIGDYGQTAPNASNEGSSDLRDDHPIAMIYSDVYTNTTAKADDFFASGSPSGVTGVDPATLLRDGMVWCSSCHDVHDNVNIPFLRMDNTNSNLCLTCHNK
jgi:predicted CXXCH cytochrome family protein